MATLQSPRLLRKMPSALSNGASQPEPVKRWDGKEGTADQWNSLRKDPELWFAYGDCRVFLHAQGESKRGPSFKVPFSGILEAKCYPLIQRYLAPSEPIPRTIEDLNELARTPSQTIDLYIPQPTTSSPQQWSLAIRNLFAWVFRQPLVGQHFGSVLVELMYSMNEFRAVASNTADLLEYLAGQGYLNLACQPQYALACLQLAETFQMSELYIKAIAHCVGMNDKLYQFSEYQSLRLATKKLIRKERTKLDSRLYDAADMLRDFLDTELSETYLGISAAGRSHLEHFRSFLMSFYSQQLGYYPPRTFEPDLYRTMREDFEALYDLLVDQRCTVAHCTAPSVDGGICTLQHVQSLDARFGFDPLAYPLPLLPQLASHARPSRVDWLAKGNQTKAKRRLEEHTALINASNWKNSIRQNSLVRAYRKFEEDLIIVPQKMDKREKVNLADARKVRWLLVYGVYQVLRDITDEPIEVREGAEVPYHLCIGTENLPPWKNNEARQRPSADEDKTSLDDTTSPLVVWADGQGENLSGGIELRPDIDYFALTHKEPPPAAANTTPTSERSNSLTQVLRRTVTLRRSFSKLRRAGTISGSAPPVPKMPYSEIVVNGYGNGMKVNKGDIDPVDKQSLAHRSDSTVSMSSSKTAVSTGSMSSAKTADSSMPDTLSSPVDTMVSPATTSIESCTPPPAAIPRPRPGRTLSRRKAILSMVSNPSPGEDFEPMPPVRRRTMSAFFDSHTDHLSMGKSMASKDVPPVPKLSRRNTVLIDLKRRSYIPSGFWTNSPTAEMPMESPPAEGRYSDEWSAMEAFMPTRVLRDDDDDDDDDDILKMAAPRTASQAWEQYAELGGLTEIK